MCVTSLTYGVAEENTTFCFLCFCASAIRVHSETGNQQGGGWGGDSSPALLFIELKASGMTGITNSANRAVYLFSVCIKKRLSLLTVSFTKG